MRNYRGDELAKISVIHLLMFFLSLNCIIVQYDDNCMKYGERLMKISDNEAG
ncbi:MAG: hypothetical protein ACI4I6_00460 [Hominimerdicola sp.]